MHQRVINLGPDGSENDAGSNLTLAAIFLNFVSAQLLVFCKTVHRFWCVYPEDTYKLPLLLTHLKIRSLR